AAGNLYLKSETKKDFETGKTIDVWLHAAYLDSSVYELKDIVDVGSFRFTYSDKEQGGDFYEDKNYEYFHKWMADGGTIVLFKKDSSETIRQYRIMYTEDPMPVGYGIYYRCLAYPVNGNKKHVHPENIRLLLMQREYYDLMEQSRFLMSSSLVASFKYKGTQDNDKQPLIDGFINKKREVWEVVKMGIK
ncbi:MAG TPA: hypothetical protein PLM49_09435, partial [Bacteroidales bacterium]|nr:hypothetical protein [Bacteroidales bacterium]